jgi:ABC-type Co2+ transport system permease subunit
MKALTTHEERREVSVTIPDILGTFGVLLLVIAYFFMQSGKWKHDNIRLPLTNLCGASLILISLMDSPNMPSILIEIVWISISLYGIVKIWRQKHAHPLSEIDKGGDDS